MAETSREIVNDMSSIGNKAASIGKQAIDQGKSAVNEVKHDLREQFGDQYRMIRGKAEDAFHASEDFVKEHPISMVLGACAVGFVAGLLARRTRH